MPRKFTTERRVGKLWVKGASNKLNTSVTIPNHVADVIRNNDLTPTEIVMMWYRNLDDLELGCPKCEMQAPRSAWKRWKWVCPQCKNVRPAE